MGTRQGQDRDKTGTRRGQDRDKIETRQGQVRGTDLHYMFFQIKSLFRIFVFYEVILQLLKHGTLSIEILLYSNSEIVQLLILF